MTSWSPSHFYLNQFLIENFVLGFKTRKLNHFLSHLAIKSEDAAKESPVLVSEDIQGLAHARPCMISVPDSTLIT